MTGTPYSKSSTGELTPRFGSSPRKGRHSSTASSAGGVALPEPIPKPPEPQAAWQRNPIRTQRASIPGLRKDSPGKQRSSLFFDSESVPGDDLDDVVAVSSKKMARTLPQPLGNTHGTSRSLPYVRSTPATRRSIPSRGSPPQTAATLDYKEGSRLQSLCRPLELPHYATEEYYQEHYDPSQRPATLGYQEFVPLLDSARSSRLLQRDVTEALIVISENGDENKKVLGQAGIIHELLELVESPDIKVRCNAVQTLSNLMSQEENRREFFSVPGAIDKFFRLSLAKVRSGRVQPGSVLAMRATTEAIAQLAHCETPQLKVQLMQSGLVKPLCQLTNSLDKGTRVAAARGLLWLCQTPGSKKDKWCRKHDLTTMDWTSEQLLALVSAAKSDDPDVTMQVLLGLRCLCTAQLLSIMLTRSELLDIICGALRGDLFKQNFTLLMAAVSLVSALADHPWPSSLIEEERHVQLLSRLLSLLPLTEEEVSSMQNAKGVMATWDEVLCQALLERAVAETLLRTLMVDAGVLQATLTGRAQLLMRNPEAGMSEVGESFPRAFMQLQCFVLVGDVLEVLEKLMLEMTDFRVGLFHLGAMQHFINIHLYTKFQTPQITCLRALCLMAGSEMLSQHVGNNPKYLDIIDFALRYEDNSVLPKTAVISIKELSKDLHSVEPLTQRGLVQALGQLTKTHDPTMQVGAILKRAAVDSVPNPDDCPETEVVQVNLLIAFTNLARKKAAKEQIAMLPQWHNIVHFADSFDPIVRHEAGQLFYEMASGQDSSTCRDALKDVAHQLKQLTRASRISPVVSQRVIDYVNQSDKIILAQSWVRGLIGRRRARDARHAASPRLDTKETRTSSVATARSTHRSAVFKALEVFSPQEMPKQLFLPSDSPSSPCT